MVFLLSLIALIVPHPFIFAGSLLTLIFSSARVLSVAKRTVRIHSYPLIRRTNGFLYRSGFLKLEICILFAFLKIGIQKLQRSVGPVPLDDEHGSDAVLLAAVCGASVDGLDQEHCWPMVRLLPL